MFKKAAIFLLKIAIILILFIFLYLAWLNIGSFNKTKLAASKFIPTPIAVLNMRIVWQDDFQKYLHGIYNTTELNINSYNQKNWENYLQSLALKSLNLNDTQNDTALRIIYFKKSYASSGVEKIFNTVKNGLQNGISFSVLNQEYDQDNYSKAFYGDLGYLDSDKILPEILKELDQMQVGDIRPIASRYGWHIIVLEEKGQNEKGGQKFHFKQIFLNVPGFEQWLYKEIKKVKIYKLMHY